MVMVFWKIWTVLFSWKERRFFRLQSKQPTRSFPALIVLPTIEAFKTSDSGLRLVSFFLTFICLTNWSFSRYLNLWLSNYILRFLNSIQLFKNQHENPLARRTSSFTTTLVDWNFRGADGNITGSPRKRLLLSHVSIPETHFCSSETTIWNSRVSAMH